MLLLFWSRLQLITFSSISDFFFLFCSGVTECLLFVLLFFCCFVLMMFVLLFAFRNSSLLLLGVNVLSFCFVLMLCIFKFCMQSIFFSPIIFFKFLVVVYFCWSFFMYVFWLLNNTSSDLFVFFVVLVWKKVSFAAVVFVLFFVSFRCSFLIVFMLRRSSRCRLLFAKIDKFYTRLVLLSLR